MKKILLYTLLLLAGVSYSQTTNLLISEYGEGSGGNKKYIEIFNGTGATIDLANYQLWKTTNGSVWNTTPLSLTGLMTNNSTYVIANNSTDVIGANLYNSFINFNGDDAIGLAWNGGSGTVFTLIDAFGDQTDPGTGWEVAGTINATVDKILTRKSSVCSPNTNWTLSRGTNTTDSEWIISVSLYNLTSQTVNLGFHTANCSGCTSTNNLTVSNCGPYTLNAQTYATSGSYTQTLTNANAAGCDSIINLTLTVKNATTASIAATACGTYTAPSGATFTTSGIKMDTITNVANCDSIITINLTMATSVTYYQDSDGDGLGNPAVSQAVCAQPTGYVTNANDCNDANAAIGLAQTFYQDFDNDGFGNALITQVACTQPTGYVSNSTDCNDSIASIYPGATDFPNNGIDENCNGSDSIIVAATLGLYEFNGNTCANSVLNVNAQPANATFSNYMIAGSSLVCNSANEYMNNTGWNTSTTIDTTQYYGFSIVPDTCYGMNLTQLLFTHRISNSGTGAVIHLRSSLDGYAADFHTITAPTPGTAINAVVNLPAAFATVYAPITFKFFVTSMGAAGATYRHDNVSVKGFINQLGTTTYYADIDGDGFGNATTTIVNCVPPVGYVTNNTDCNDADSTEFPGATWVLDNDNDGFGATGSTVTSCTQPNGYISSLAPVDCNDANAAIGAAITYYQDADLDGFGNAAITQTACTAPTGYVTNNTDCDDANALVGGANTTFYADADNDTYGDATVTMIACIAPTGYVANNTDCDDTNPATHPNAVEVCDGFDNNCNGSNDEGLTTFTWYMDSDNDGLGNPAVTAQNCLQPSGYVGNDNDCDDSDADPNAGETLYYADVDNDTYGDPFDAISTCTPPSGYVVNNEDCDDTNPAINPNATDNTGNGIDENCDGVDGNLGIEDAIFASVSVAPNPGTNEVSLTFNGDLTGLTYSFIGIDGKAIPAMIVTQTTTSLTFNTAAFATGTYLIQLSNGTVVKTIRWIKN